MARTPGWWLRRLRAMSGAEVAHRTLRLARHPIDLVRMRAGRYAPPPAALATWRGPHQFYFAPDLVTTPVSHPLLEQADAICRGQREVLGLGWIELPADPWHFEPLAKLSWPAIDAARVLAAAPGHLDARLTWEFNRGHEWVVLARVHAATRNPRYRARLESELTSWRRANPIGIGINWASAMEAAIRIHSLAWVAGFLRGDALLPAVATMIYEHATFVAAKLSRFSSANNHLIVELTALIVAGHTLGIDRWHGRALGELAVELERQTYSDGVNAEMATHYHVFVLEALLLVAWLERAHGAPHPELETVIGRMADYLAMLRCSDGSLLQQGDSDDGKVLAFFSRDHAGQLIEAAAALHQKGPRTTTPAADREGTFWLTGGQTASPPPSPRRSRAFRPSGQIVLCSERMTATFDAGPFGFGSLAAHAHCDALAVNVAIDGRPFLVDRGTYRYNGDRESRDRYRMTAAHNTLQVGAREQADAAGPFLWSRRPTVTLERCDLGPDGDIVQASHDGFAPIIHRRTLVHRRGVLVILDRISAAARITTRYHLAPYCDVARTATAGLFASATTSGWLWTGSSEVACISTPHSDNYASQAPARRVECAVDATKDTCLMAAIGAATEGRRDAVSGLLAFAVERRAISEAIRAGPDHVLVRL